MKIGAEISLWIYDKTNEITMKRELGAGRLLERGAPTTYQDGCNNQSSVENLPYHLTTPPGQRNGSNGHCTGTYNGCPCQDQSPSCPLRKPRCEEAGCNGAAVGGLCSNKGKCQGSGDLNGCLCLATRSTAGHCGQQGPCNENGCDGMFVGVRTAVCM